MGRDKKPIHEYRWCRVTSSVGSDGLSKVKFRFFNYLDETLLVHEIGRKFFRLLLNSSSETWERFTLVNIQPEDTYIFEVPIRSCNGVVWKKNKGHTNGLDIKVFNMILIF